NSWVEQQSYRSSNMNHHKRERMLTKNLSSFRMPELNDLSQGPRALLGVFLQVRFVFDIGQATESELLLHPRQAFVLDFRLHGAGCIKVQNIVPCGGKPAVPGNSGVAGDPRR